MEMFDRSVLCGIGDEAATNIDDQIKAHLELEWQHIELRTIDRKKLTDLDKNQFQLVKRKLRDAGLMVSALASGIGNWDRPITNPFDTDLSELYFLIDFASHLETKYIRIMSYPNYGLTSSEWKKNVFERIFKLAELAQKEGVILLHENCAGWAGREPQNALELVQTINSPSLRLLFDTGNGIHYKYDTYSYLKQVFPWVEHVHIKDGYQESESGDIFYTYPGLGASHLEQCVGFLWDKGYSGKYSIEPHIDLIPHSKKENSDSHKINSYIKYGKMFEDMMNEIEKVIKK